MIVCRKSTFTTFRFIYKSRARGIIESEVQAPGHFSQELWYFFLCCFLALEMFEVSWCVIMHNSLPGTGQLVCLGHFTCSLWTITWLLSHPFILRRSACQSKCSCSAYCFTCFRACNFSVKCLMLVFRQLVSTVCKKYSVSVMFCFTYAGRFTFLFMSPLLQKCQQKWWAAEFRRLLWAPLLHAVCQC